MMKSIMDRAVMCILLVASAALAGPFDAAVVSGDANWVMHINVEAMRNSTMGKALLQEELNAVQQNQLQQAKEKFGMDPREDLSGITLYGSGIDQDDVVVLVRGKFDRAKLIAQVTALDGYNLIRHGTRDVHSWIDVDQEEASRVHGALLDGSSGVLSKSLDHLKKALAVIDGAQQNISQGGMNTSVLSASGVMLAATADFSNVDLASNPMLAGANVNARTFQMQMREAAGALGLRVAVQQASEQEAEQSLTMLNGLKMMGMMQLQQQNPDLAGLFQAITINRNGDTLQLTMDYPAAKIVEMIKSAAQQAGGM